MNSTIWDQLSDFVLNANVLLTTIYLSCNCVGQLHDINYYIFVTIRTEKNYPGIVIKMTLF